MSQHIVTLFTILSAILITLLSCSGALYLRRLWVAYDKRRHALHVRLLRAELTQALARDEASFLIAHWTRRDRKAAFEVSAQLLGFIKGRDREKLEAIVETNRILEPNLLHINRVSKKHRIAAIRNLAAFGNRSVQGTLEQMMLHDPSAEVRLEAAIAITVAGKMPAPWRVIQSVCKGAKLATPNHYRLFEQMMPASGDAMLALATMQEDRIIRLLAIHALGFADAKSAAPTLRTLQNDADAEIAAKATEALERIALVSPKFKPRKKATVMYLVENQAA